MLCPKDFHICTDDLCRSSNRCIAVGEALYYKCACGAMVSDMDASMCSCEDDYNAANWEYEQEQQK